jgi:hypothetical protein
MNSRLVKKIAWILGVCIVATPLTACKKETAPASTVGNPAVVDASSSSSDKKEVSTEVKMETPVAAAMADGGFANKDKKRVKAKGLYLTATSAGARLDHYIKLANETEINSYVIDYKNDYGKVYVDSKVPLATEVKAVEKAYNAAEVTKKLHDNNIYAIARIVCFKDPILAKSKPEYAIKKKDGSLYVHNGVNWVDAYNKDAWQYNIDLAKEALAQGFDEVQFDYIRFPDGKKSEMVFGDTRGLKLHENIEEFLAEARKQLPDAILSGDVFAIICESPGDTENIGQYFERIGKNLDYVYPMAYPSHYALGQIINGVKFAKPDFEPYNLIKQTLLKAKSRLDKVEGHKPILRTYLQDFSATWIGAGNWQYYEDEQIKQQIKGVIDAGYEEWFLWDPMNNYRENAFAKE